MKDIDLKTIQQIITNQIDYLNIKYISIFVSINILVALINWLVQQNIKGMDNKIYKNKLREDRRLVVIEDIYKELVSYTYILNPKEFENTIGKTSLLEKKIAENKLYITKTLNKSIIAFLDYTKTVASDYRKKDFKVESDLLDNIEKEFNK